MRTNEATNDHGTVYILLGGVRRPGRLAPIRAAWKRPASFGNGWMSMFPSSHGTSGSPRSSRSRFPSGKGCHHLGYSGGGSRATYLANAFMGKAADRSDWYCMTTSPKWQMQPIGHNVVRAICYHNTNPMMLVPLLGELGGGVLTVHWG